MDIEATKLELIQLLLQNSKKDVLEKIKHIFEEESEDWWDDLNEQDKKEIELGLQDFEKGDVYDHQQVRNIFNKWQQK